MLIRFNPEEGWNIELAAVITNNSVRCRENSDTDMIVFMCVLAETLVVILGILVLSSSFRNYFHKVVYHLNKKYLQL